MNISLRPELEKFLNDRAQSGCYPSVDDAVNEAVQQLKEAEEAETKLESLLQEAEDSGPATEMTRPDWADIENEGLKRLRSRKSACLRMARVIKRIHAKRDLTDHFVFLGENASVDVARRFLPT